MRQDFHFIFILWNSVKENIPYENNPLTEGAYKINFSSETFNFSEISEEEVTHACLSFKMSFGYDIDNIFSSFIKPVAPSIS